MMHKNTKVNDAWSVKLKTLSKTAKNGLATLRKRDDENLKTSQPDTHVKQMDPLKIVR